MQNVFTPVHTFMIACDQVETGITKQSDLYLDLITEELIHELLKEYDRKNLIGIADGIADSIWVIAGFMISLNLNVANAWIRIQSIIADRETKESEEEIFELLLIYAEIRNEYFYKKTGKHSVSMVYFEQFGMKLIISLIALAKTLNIPINEVYGEVARSNMSKISSNGKVLKNEFGKVQKPDTYSPPNINKFLKG